MATALVWLRRDLRVADNPALSVALERFQYVLPLYIHAPEEDRGWSPGGAQRWWLDHSLRALSAECRDRGTHLTIRCGPTLEALADLIEATGASAVYWNRLYEPAQVARDREIKHWLREQHDIEAESFNASLLHEPSQLVTGQGNPYKVFTPFWRRLQSYGLPDCVKPAPEHIPGPAKPPESEPIDSLGLKPAIRWHEGLEATWTPGEAGAHARLEEFCSEIVGDYATARDRPALDGTSALSPHLHFGEIGPRQIVRALRNRGLDAQDSAATFLSELGWREFAHHLLFHFPESPERPLNRRFEDFPWRTHEAAEELAA